MPLLPDVNWLERRRERTCERRVTPPLSAYLLIRQWKRKILYASFDYVTLVLQTSEAATIVYLMGLMFYVCLL